MSFPFTGSYDGAGFESSGLKIDAPTAGPIGLFGLVVGGTIENVHIVNADVTGGERVGALVGYVQTSGTLRGNSSSGVVRGVRTVGGLVGQFNGTILTNSFSSASVTAQGWPLRDDIAVSSFGGLVGKNESAGISKSYSIGAVADTSGRATNVGGLIGERINNSTALESFWDTSSSGQATSAGGEGKSSADLKTRSTFSAWDIVDGWEAFNFTTPTNYWGICSVENSGYPFLLSEFSAEDDPCVAPVSGDSGNAPVSGDSGNSGESQSAAAVLASPTATTPQRVVPRAPAIPPLILTGPVFRAGVTPVAPETPSAFIGGVPAVLQKTVPDSTRLSLATGSVALDMTVASGSGARSTDGVTQLGVKNRSSIDLAGSGLLPGSTVQVFIPLTAEDSREVAQLVVNPDGTFSGAAALSTDRLAAPLPIGPRLLQLVTIDEDGNQIVLEMTVVIEQADPDPEINRELGDIPNMTPGSLEATSAGLPVDVSITALADQKLAVVEGDGWVMAIAIAPNAADGAVEETPSGATLKLVRDETALVSGSGFMAGTRADVWLFSEPTLVGTALIDANGEFTGEVSIDPNLIPAGEHTLQLQGVGTDGYVKAANLGVLVEEAGSGAPAPDAGGFPWSFLWWILAGIVALGALWFGLRRRRSSSHA